MFSTPSPQSCTIMAKLMIAIFFLTTCTYAVHDSLAGALPLLFEGNLTINLTTNISAQAPYYRDISAGHVWVMPSNRYDIGGRGMSCECFDPDETCCMPSDTSIAPFCISSNSTCCANTYCNVGETCCDHGCCPPETNCMANGAGCCPLNQSCQAKATCQDALDPLCRPVFPPARGCCPSTLPYCRSYAPSGLGCFASSTMSVPTSSYSFTDTGITHSASSSSPSAAITETATTSVEVTVTNTLTLTLLAHGSVKYSLIFPSPPSKTSASGTTTILEMATTVATTIPPPSDHLAPSPSTTERSTLCFDATVGSNVPCPLPPTSPPATQTTVVAEMLSDAPLFTFAGWLERLLTVLIMNAIAYAYDTLVGW